MLKQDAYLDYVMSEAQKIGKLFILDTGEGNGFIDSDTGWDIEDLSGWLIAPSEIERFLMAQKNRTTDDEFSAFYVFAKWSRVDSGRIKISFRRY